MNSSNIFEKGENIEWSEFENEAVILKLDSGAFLKLNNIGKEIFKLVDGKNTIQDIQNKISLEYRIDKKVIVDDIKTFMNDLLENNLIKKNQ